ncbi:MAG: hypothetical protein ACP5OG_04085 [Candidatus Nanoarchaeia archaeon]
MALEDLIKLGYSEQEAEKLLLDVNFHHKTKSYNQLKDLFEDISGHYNCAINIIKNAILSFPPFAGLNHERVIKQGIEIYGIDNEDKIKNAILKHPQFAGYDHERVIKQGIEIYGIDNEDRIKDAVLSFPPFAGLNHERVVRQKTRLGRIAGLDEEQTKNYLLDIPFMAGYSAKRYLAAFDIGRQLREENFNQDREMLECFFKYIAKSPYVPKTNRRRISQVQNYQDPPLLIAMRKRLNHIKNKKK